MYHHTPSACPDPTTLGEHLWTGHAQDRNASASRQVSGSALQLQLQGNGACRPVVIVLRCDTVLGSTSYSHCEPPQGMGLVCTTMSCFTMVPTQPLLCSLPTPESTLQQLYRRAHTGAALIIVHHRSAAAAHSSPCMRHVFTERRLAVQRCMQPQAS